MTPSTRPSRTSGTHRSIDTGEHLRQQPTPLLDGLVHGERRWFTMQPDTFMKLRSKAEASGALEPFICPGSSRRAARAQRASVFQRDGDRRADLDGFPRVAFELAVELVLRHRERFKPLRSQSIEMRTLVHLVEKRRQLVEDRLRLSNRLTSTLKAYFPQAVEWFSHKETFVFCAFITRWPTLKQVKRARRSTLERFFREQIFRGDSDGREEL